MTKQWKDTRSTSANIQSTHRWLIIIIIIIIIISIIIIIIIIIIIYC